MSKEDQKNIVSTLIGVTIGAVTVHVLREYVDVQYPSVTIMKDTLKGFSAPSAYAPIVFGGVGTAYEMSEAKKRSMKYRDTVITGMSAALLIGGAISGLTPKVPAVSAAGMRYAQNVLPRQLAPIPTRTNVGYPAIPNGVKGGSV